MTAATRQKLLLGLAFVLAIAVTFVFAFRAGRYARRIRWENEPIRSWMSIPFIAHTHRVQPEILFRALGLPPAEHDRRPLRRIARQQGKPVGEVIHEVESALAKAGHAHPAQGGPPGKAP